LNDNYACVAKGALYSGCKAMTTKDFEMSRKQNKKSAATKGFQKVHCSRLDIT
jgi:hypothetical protein